VILFGFLSVFIFLSVLRWIRRELNERRVGQRQAVLVGPASAAEAFKRTLMSHPSPPLEVVGYVELEVDPDSTRSLFSTLPRLGRVDQLRDIVRLRHIDDIVFAAGHVTNQAMFMLMQELLDLPIRFKILQQRQTQVVGKDFVSELGLVSPLLDAEAAVSLPRGQTVRRLADVSISLSAGLIFVLIALPAFVMSPSARWLRRLRDIASGLPALLLGRSSLVGFDHEVSYRPPESWRIQRGLVPLVPVRGSVRLSSDQLQGIYWRYAQSQSFGLDVRIVTSYIRTNNLTSLV
jgi:hypothetical protein